MAERSDLPPPGERRDGGLQRVRVGVMGLAAVFLLTLLAAALFALLGPDVHGPAARTAGRAGGNQMADEAPKEPLAELGVAPGNAPRPLPGTGKPAPASPGLAPMSAPAPAPPPAAQPTP